MLEHLSSEKKAIGRREGSSTTPRSSGAVVASEMAKTVAHPRVGYEAFFKQLCRYLTGRLDYHQLFLYQSEEHVLTSHAEGTATGETAVSHGVSTHWCRVQGQIA